MPIRTLKSNILRESYGRFTKTIFYHFHCDFYFFYFFYFFCDEIFDSIKFDDNHGLKLKNYFISSEHGQTRVYYISKFMKTSTWIQW